MTSSASAVRAERERVLSFQGGCNFRDIGGYRTQQGTSTRWGKVFRTGVLTYFTEDDHAPLTQLQVRAICDLRRLEEREREPTRWPHEFNALSWADGTVTPTVRGLAADRPRNAAGMFDAMVALYRALPEWMGPRIGGMFSAIAAGDVPLVVHCAAGKDRTGVAVAVLLRSLGVPEETAIQDYLLTNTSGNFEEFIRSRQQAQLGVTDNHAPLLSMPEDMRRVLFSADAAFLHEALAQIGDVEGYLAKTAGVTPAMQEKVRAALLE
ncbi:tyrosine-protein phosphatase [Peristeroidobacter soli]|jgi:protein-tyrosine phosphatase|uniref:tyrosine-protein phosphatase n=1 Tax=Peristeroidobacter soli TaxID=2497877 RepID=UPI00101D6DFA|nr:tyrosine-protein phosphatase [Peristeroidobacter soli]